MKIGSVFKPIFSFLNSHKYSKIIIEKDSNGRGFQISVDKRYILKIDEKLFIDDCEIDIFVKHVLEDVFEYIERKQGE